MRLRMVRDVRQFAIASCMAWYCSLDKRHRNGLLLLLARPLVAGSARPRAAILNIAVTDPADRGQLLLERAILGA